MTKLIQKFNYPDLIRENLNGRRYYTTEDGLKLPSVTTILSETADKTAIINWRKRIGEKKANEITAEAAGRGTSLHTFVEHFLLGLPEPEGNNYIHVKGRRMANILISQGLNKLNEAWGMEIKLFYPELYAGSTDLVGLYNGIPSIIDFKTARRKKKPEWIEDYFIQTCAYAMAHDHIYETKITQGVILLVTDELEFQEFCIMDDEFDIYKTKWAMRLEQYLENK